MEGVRRIFSESQTKYNIRYVQYLGDGDSKGFLAVQKDSPYGPECQVEKLECVGHVQKRMGNRLRKLKKKLGTAKLADGKSIGGKGRLTDALIDQIQTFYGLAIRRNSGNLESMKKAVWAVYFHLVSTDYAPSHALCSEDWCKYLQASDKESYKHEKHTHVPSAIMDVIKPIFRDLAHPNLLMKCLHGGTQNPNESLNNVIWVRIPKNVFVQLNTLKLGAMDGAAVFNDGNISR